MSDAAIIPFKGRPPQPPLEIELKFQFEPGAAGALEAALAVLGGASQAKTLISAYYDDADESLRRAAFTLRVREVGGGFVQTIKCAAEGALFSRGEWETATPDRAPDIAAARHTPLAKVLDKAGPLRPAFASGIERLERTIAYGGGEIEIALDKGEVEADGGRRAPVCQLELELKHGDPDLLFRLARTLMVQVPLHLSFETKAGLGYALLSPPPASVKGERPQVRAGMTAGQAFQTVARAALRQIVANAHIVRTRRSPEALHQLRVGLRRLRTAMTLFKSVVTDARSEAVKAELKWLAGQLDEVRDTDVFTAETYRPGLEALGAADGVAALGKRLKQAQTRGYDHALKALKSRRGSDVALLAAEWIETGEWRARAEAAQAVGGFAEEILNRLDGKMTKGGAKLARMAAEDRHRVRITVKKLRYGLEFFEGLYSAKRARRFVDSLRAFQDTLGELNDIAVARRTAAGLAIAAPAPQVGFAAGLVAGLRAAGEAGALDRAATQYRALKVVKRPW